MLMVMYSMHMTCLLPHLGTHTSTSLLHKTNLVTPTSSQSRPFPLHNAILSVQYYSLASQQGEPEADMALKVVPLRFRWCHLFFSLHEPLALHFASKAASKNLPSALLAMRYYAQVGLDQPKDIDKARHQYSRAVHARRTSPSALLGTATSFLPIFKNRVAATLILRAMGRLSYARPMKENYNNTKRKIANPSGPTYQATTAIQL